MNRRGFLAGLGGAVAWPLAPRAQQPARPGVRRIGALIGTVETDPESRARVAALEQGLDVLGWTVGRNVLIAYRFGSADPALTQKFAADLHDTNRVRAVHRSGWRGIHQEPGAARRKHHRVHQLRVPAEREMAGAA